MRVSGIWGRAFRAVPLLIIASIHLASCAERNDEMVLQREWTANAEYAGDVWAEELSKETNAPISVHEGSESTDPIKMVRTGKAAVGVASADRILRENESGAGLVILAAATYRSPVVFLSRLSAGVNKPEDFRGKVIGIQTGTNTELVFKSLMLAHGIDIRSLRVVESGWGTQSFETGDIGVLSAFAYDEPVQLRRKGIEVKALKPEDYGINYIGTVYFARKDFVAANSDKVQSFMNSLVSGWRSAQRRPDDAINRLAAKFPKVSVEKERTSLRVGLEYFAGDDGLLLYASPDQWDIMAKHLIKLGVISSFKFNENIDYRYLEKALAKWQKND